MDQPKIFFLHYYKLLSNNLGQIFKYYHILFMIIQYKNALDTYNEHCVVIFFFAKSLTLIVILAT